MESNRIEAFSDAVIAIIITIMVLELKVPHEPTWKGIADLYPVVLSYILSFIYVGIYWNNHHHLFHAVEHVDGVTLWANMHLLFWLSILPFATGWMGENHFAQQPVLLYGFVLLMAAVAYFLLVRTLLRDPGKNKDLKRAVGEDRKGKISIVVYLAAIALSFISGWIGIALYALLAGYWLLPDRRIEEKGISHGS